MSIFRKHGRQSNTSLWLQNESFATSGSDADFGPTDDQYQQQSSAFEGEPANRKKTGNEQSR